MGRADRGWVRGVNAASKGGVSSLPFPVLFLGGVVVLVAGIAKSNAGASIAGGVVILFSTIMYWFIRRINR
jgi:hypothetical protein